MSKWLDRNVGAPGPFLKLFVCEKEYLKQCKRLSVDAGKWVSDGARASTHVLDGNKGVVCLVCIDDDGLNDFGVVEVLIHESVHVWRAYLDGIGEDKPADEQEAYGVQMLASSLIAEYIRLRKRKLKLGVDDE